MWCLFQQVGGVSGNVDFAVDVETANIDNITIVVQVSEYFVISFTNCPIPISFSYQFRSVVTCMLT